MNALTHLKELISTFPSDFQRVCNLILDRPDFAVWTASDKAIHHHYGKGGLAQHTWEVMRLCLDVKGSLGVPVEDEEIIFSALYHDVGKLFDYEPLKTHPDFQEWVGNTHKRQIHHISESALLWDKNISTEPALRDRYRDKVLHNILAHHGERAYGSPVSPYTRGAWLLHCCDQLSARMDDCVKHDILDHRK